MGAAGTVLSAALACGASAQMAAQADCRGDPVSAARGPAVANAAAVFSTGLDGAALVLPVAGQQAQGRAAPDRKMDYRNHQAIRCRKRLRGSPAPLGRRTHTGLAQSKPPPRQGLRADHRIGHCLVVHRLNPALCPPHRKNMKS